MVRELREEEWVAKLSHSLRKLCTGKRVLVVYIYICRYVSSDNIEISVRRFPYGDMTPRNDKVGGISIQGSVTFDGRFVRQTSICTTN